MTNKTPRYRKNATRQQQLDLLAEAVQRAREAAIDSPGHVTDTAEPVQITAPSAPFGADEPVTSPLQGTAWIGSTPVSSGGISLRRRRPLGGSGRPNRRRTLTILATALVAVGILTVSLVERAGASHNSASRTTRPPSSTRPLTTAPSTTQGGSTPSSTRPGSTGTSPTTTTPSATSTTTTSAAGSGTSTTVATTTGQGIPAPELSLVAPSRGGTGTVLVIRGTNFYSPGGIVLARFDGEPAPTQCPNQNMCKVTVPQLSHAPGTLALTITTQSGTSNALSFLYR
ncbi:MAG: IPT/TIG domain-containing protein [Acidimicrobiales bacterium]